MDPRAPGVSGHPVVMRRSYAWGLCRNLRRPALPLMLSSLPRSLALTCLMACALALGAGFAKAGGDAAAAPQPTSLRFADFFRQPTGPRGLEITDRLRAVDGQQVRIVGFMVQQEAPTPGRFMLTPRPVRMSEHADGDADDLPPATLMVHLPADMAGRAVQHREGPLALTGRLQVGRLEEDDGRVSWVRLYLDADALK